MKHNTIVLSIFILLAFSSCALSEFSLPKLVPAKEFSRAIQNGERKDFSMFEVFDEREKAQQDEQAALVYTKSRQEEARAQFGGDPRFLQQGLQYHGGIGAPPLPVANHNAQGRAPLPGPPPGSFAPYYRGQMRSNPSLWPDEAEGLSLFRDQRAFRPMDIITIRVSEDSEATSKAETDAESTLSILAGITEFFGVETKDWAANNTSLNPAALIDADTEFEFEGEGETKREGTLKARISAVVMEVLPNGLLRIEGTKIISVNAEEEVMVISGLIRSFDVESTNEIDSGRIANVRIDFYGRGVVNDQQAPGWLGTIFRKIWPF